MRQEGFAVGALAAGLDDRAQLPGGVADAQKALQYRQVSVNR